MMANFSTLPKKGFIWVLNPWIESVFWRVEARASIVAPQALKVSLCLQTFISLLVFNYDVGAILALIL